MPRDQFIDVATGETITWEVNHEVVEAAIKRRNMGRLQPTAAGWTDVGPVRQQAPDGPELHRLTGLIATREQHEAFMRFWKICALRTVHYLPCTGGRQEVVIRSYEPTRRRVVRGPRGARLHIWRYTLEMEIITQIVG